MKLIEAIIKPVNPDKITSALQNNNGRVKGEKMKLVEGTIYTRDLEKLSTALEANGFIVQEVMYDGRRAINTGILKGIAYIYNLINRVKIRIVIHDELLGTLMDTLRSFGECSFNIFPGEQICFG
jgi:nitrogen regulatory protein PII